MICTIMVIQTKYWFASIQWCTCPLHPTLWNNEWRCLLSCLPSHTWLIILPSSLLYAVPTSPAVWEEPRFPKCDVKAAFCFCGCGANLSKNQNKQSVQIPSVLSWSRLLWLRPINHGCTSMLPTCSLFFLQGMILFLSYHGGDTTQAQAHGPSAFVTGRVNWRNLLKAAFYVVKT